MKLFIAEKPSLGRAIADVLPKPLHKGDGFIRAANGDTVSWCIGHLLEQAEPEAYDPIFKVWRAEHLPIMPDKWQLKPKPKTRKQLTILKKLIKESDTLINVGDPDREGQLLIDEAINYCKIPKAKLAKVQRCLISDLNPTAVKNALNNLQNNSDFIPLATSALARTRADWLYGINMTRLCTLQGQKSGFSGVLSIGRVQTPLLGLVVKRDLEIEQFVSKPFYELEISLQTQDKYRFLAKWVPSDTCQPYMDDESRVLSKKLVENVASRVINQSGEIVSFSANIKKQAPPLPYNLSSLQIDAAKRFGLSAKVVLDNCQQLYEKHKLITYPRSDCRYLPSAHFNDAKHVINAINKTLPSLAEITKMANTELKSKAWDDKKVSAHHAIIPTRQGKSASTLSSNEEKIYGLICRQYITQFFPTFNYRQIIIESNVNGGTFVTKRKEIISLGWKSVLPIPKQKKEDTENDNTFESETMPLLKKGDTVKCIDTKISDKKTTPPKRFNDATLLSAMTGIARYVQDPNIRKILRDTDGLGTEATRAGIIELLFHRKFLIRQKKDIHSTAVGRQLIQTLPESISLPDMTAKWESQLQAISQKNLTYQTFMQAMTDTLKNLIDEVRAIHFSEYRNEPSKAHKAYRKHKKPSIKSI